ncbi:restriction endonuclease subunit S [Methylomonas fluvii]|uniref:Restriction endonuclease subunit S n=1 Tax=Methylomonas fluvii TaxID=1854564 RepID=A0ABR9DF82_9GAMM|nr:restriction endonuclease subunit S [Methylomonas fluvii]MBD9361755.1 restriction endonuclease subunit S [Methylomonas fluvii]
MIQQVSKRYDAYRDSGVEWLGEIPKHWKQNHLKRICRKITDGAHTSPDLSSNDYPFLTVVNLNNGKLDFDNCLFTSSDDYEKLVRNGCQPRKYDVLYSKDGTISETAVIHKDKNFVVGSSFIIIRPDLNITNSVYISYLLSSVVMRFQARIYVKGASLPRISIFNVSKLISITPSLPEQKSIVDYLDEKTAQIDQQIDLLSQKAKRYGELKQALINETVTRGLDITVPLKDSGIEWIGEIPTHWDLQRIGTAFEERSEKVSDTDYPPLSVSMGGIVPQMESVAKTDNNDNRKRVAVGDYVINSRSDRRGASGISIYDGSVSVINIVLAPRRAFFGKYLHHLFRSYRFIEEFYRVGRGIVDDLWTTRYSVMKAIEFAYPSYDEQKAIADYLDQKTAQIDAIVETINTQIDNLKALRKTLINDVVTGKICIL